MLPFLAAVLIAQTQAPVKELPFAKDIAAFKEKDQANPPEKGQILFIGSSSFTRWTDVGTYFPDRKILNRAFGGSSLPDVIRCVDDIVFPYEPKQVVIYCGENDFVSNPPPTVIQVSKRFEALFKSIRHKMKNVPIVYVSMKPSISRWELREKFTQANQMIANFMQRQSSTQFIDVWPVMLNDKGEPKPEIYVADKLHMNAKGYALWKPLLEKALLK